jgi:hypothetical protein
MKLSKQDADLFFKLMWSLQNFVNQRLGIISEATTIDEYQKLPSSKKMIVREALYEKIELIDAYLEENHQRLSGEELSIIESWKNFQRGDYFIERLLKNHAIFMRDNEVYAVLALYESFEDVIPFVTLPYYAHAVLLPFKGRIIYDGLLQGYAISFGAGIRQTLKETYMTAKQNGRIIASFDPEKRAEVMIASERAVKDFGPTIDEILQQVKKLRSSSHAPAIQSPAFNMVKASIEFAQLAVENPDDIEHLWKALKKVQRTIKNAETVLYRSGYY